MSTRRKRAAKRQLAPSKKPTPSTDSPAASSRPRVSKTISAGSALDECVGAICLVEVTLHSMESQEIASPEQEVLRRALKAIWSVHDWIYELPPNDLNRDGANREDKP